MSVLDVAPDRVPSPRGGVELAGVPLFSDVPHTPTKERHPRHQLMGAVVANVL